MLCFVVSCYIYYIVLYYILFLEACLFSNERQKMISEVRGGGKEQEGVKGGENIIMTYYVRKNTFSIKGRKEYI